MELKSEQFEILSASEMTNVNGGFPIVAVPLGLGALYVMTKVCEQVNEIINNR